MRWPFIRESSSMLEPTSARFMYGWRRLRHLWRPSVRTDVDDEIAFHMEMRIAEYVALGLPQDEAEAKARAQFGDLADVSDGLVRIDRRHRRRVDLLTLLETVIGDVRSGMRTLRTHWISSIVAIATLAIGFGASVAVFSIVDAILIRPLPYTRANELVVVSEELTARGTSNKFLSGPDIVDIRDATRDLATIAIIVTSPATPYSVDDTPPEVLQFASVSTNFFKVLGIPVLLGRDFTTDDGTPRPAMHEPLTSNAAAQPELARVAIIGYAYWQRRFHGDSSVIGRVIVGPFGPTTIVGVAPPIARVLVPQALQIEQTPDVWEANRRDLAKMSRAGSSYLVIARLRAPNTLNALRSRIDSLGAVFSNRYPDSHRATGVVIHADGMHDRLVHDIRPALIALAGAVILVLLIACANVGNLLLLRGAARERELAIRIAIGGSSWRIIRQLLTESLLLASIASCIGVALASFGIATLTAHHSVGLPRLDAVAIDHRVLAFALGLTLVAPMLFGLVPAVRAIHGCIAATLQTSGRTPSLGAATRLRSTVVIVEVALSFVLLIACGLMARTFINLTSTDLGFDPHGVSAFTISNRNFTRAEDRLAFVHQVRDRVASIDGVDGVTISTGLPFSNEGTTARWGTAAFLSDATRSLGDADLRAVLPGYFELLRIPLVDGRPFTDADELSSDHSSVVIDDESATRAFGGDSPIGKTIVTHILGRSNEPFTVVGVVRHERHGALLGDDRPIIYFPWATGALEYGRWAIRIHSNRAAVAASVRNAIQSMPIPFTSNTRTGGPDTRHLIMNDLQPLDDFIDRAMGPTRLVVFVVGVLAAIAAALTAIGLYNVLASSVRQRTAEIGVRMAFGAEPRDIFSLVVKDGLRLSVIGLALGALLALASTRILASLLAGVRATDPLTYVVMSIVFLAIALLATFVPARRAASLDPNVALRVDGA